MKAIVPICILLTTATLAGCADVKTDVQATSALQWAPADMSYRIVRSPLQRTDPEENAYRSPLQENLARYGFSDAARSGDEPHYLISVAYESRQTKISVQAHTTACDRPQASCGDSRSAGMWMSSGRYLHRLTLRFLDARSGEERYKVTSTSRDSYEHSSRTIRYLVAAALARFPYDGGDWQVKLRSEDGDGPARAVWVKSVER
jgi:hypothetical protein